MYVSVTLYTKHCTYICVFMRTTVTHSHSLQEALRYCAQLEEEVGCDALNVACKQLDNIVTRTNNAVHLSLIEGFDEPLVELGALLYQVINLNIVTSFMVLFLCLLGNVGIIRAELASS